MNKKLAVAIPVVILVGLAFPLANLGPRTVDPAIAARCSHPAVKGSLDFFAESCMDCHSAEVVMPFYASFPIAKQLIEWDRSRALSFWDMDREFIVEGGPGEASLAKVQQVLDAGSMPAPQYVALHWNAAVSADEAAQVMDMVRKVRAERAPGYGDAADPLLARAVLPIRDQSAGLDPAKVALGKALYHDKRLSGDGTLSCASCHDLAKGGTDQAQTSTGIRDQLGPINSPTTFNSVYALAQFWDGRASDLQEQAAGPVENPGEMGDKWDDVVAELATDPEFVATFMAIYGPADWAPVAAAEGVAVLPAELNKDNLTDAIAAFEKTLVTPNSAFDKYLLGDATALSAEELAGWKHFDEQGCDTCHAGQAMGQVSYERMGIMADYAAERGNVTEADFGRFNATKNEADKYCFKVPTLRNVEVTFPYFHDGSTSDLAVAVHTMGRYQREEGLNEKQVTAIAAFLKTLTGEYQGKKLTEL